VGLSNIEDALCGPEEALLGSGFAFTTPSNGEAIWTQALPTVNGETKGVRRRQQRRRNVPATYFAVKDIQQAVKNAEEPGTTTAYPQPANATRAPLRS
jgi:hypothetical protein